MAAEFATPLWLLGMSTYGFCQLPGSKEITLVCCYSQNGSWQLAKKTLATQSETTKIELKAIATDYTQISDIYCDGSFAWMVGATPKAGGELIEYDVRSEKLKPVTAVTELPFNKEYISEPKLSASTLLMIHLKAILNKMVMNKRPMVSIISHKICISLAKAMPCHH
jgi:hypothetical protein